MSLNGGIFRARKRPNTAVSVSEVSTTTISTSSGFPSTKSARELTKNTKYCVSKLPAVPSVLEPTSSSSSEVFNAYSDHESNYSLVVNEKTINVWSYKSTDPAPLAIQFPVESLENELSLLPLAILTKPSSGTSQDPGLAILYSSTGRIKFYESVQHAPALGLINDKSLELTIPINSKKGEYITLAENVEPAGIIVATSWKRCVLISLRDFKSKPHLSSVELLGPNSSPRLFLSSVLFGNSSGASEDEIVSIKSGKITNHGMTQEIVIQDSAGNFDYFTYQMLSANGSPYIDKKKSFRYNLVSAVENSVDGFLPGASLNCKFLDLWPLLLQENIYLCLCDVDEFNSNSGSKNLMLLTIKIDATGVLLYGTHKLMRYEPQQIASSTNKPKLFLPSPGNTAFVTIDNSIILTDIDTSYIQSPTTFSYYKPRWEDVIRLKSSVETIGFGYENKSADNSNKSNPALIIITKNFGVLRIERFSEEDDKSESKDPTDPLSIVKSHIEQAIFYAKSPEIEFDIYREVPQSVVLLAIESVVTEIINSTSPYLPAFLPSISEMLLQKSKLYQELITFSNRNFTGISSKIIPKIVEFLEKVEAALNLWLYIDEQQDPELRKVLEAVVLESNTISLSENDEVLRTFFSKGVQNINPVFTNLTERLVDNGNSTSNIVDLIVKVLYNGVYQIEAKYLLNHLEYPVIKSWIYDTDLVVRIEDIFTSEYCKDVILTQQRQANLIKFVEVLYYFVTIAIRYMQRYDQHSESLSDYSKWYKSRRHAWINVLLKNALVDDALSVAESYRDFSSVAFILDTEKEKGDNEEDINSKYGYYFDTYGYEFASSLYDYYLKNDKIQPLLLGFTNYKNYLDQYLEKGTIKTSSVAWIRYLLDLEFSKASDSLTRAATHKVDENIENREFKYSLAKLATIAASNGSGNSRATQEKLQLAENNLIAIRSQRALFKALVGEEQFKVLTYDFAKRFYTNASVENETKDRILEGSFTQLVENRPISNSDLINWLTLLKPSALDNNNFTLALKVASVEVNESRYQYLIKLIWLRLLVIGDDWSLLHKDLISSSDSQSKQKIRKTVLFHTLVEIGLDAKLVEQMHTLLRKGQIDDEIEDDINVREHTSLLLAKLTDYREEYNFQSWVESVQQEVKNSSNHQY